jgi:hypothetical protein
MLYISYISSIFGLSQHGDIDEGPHMSRMADLHISISSKLEKESKGFAAMVDCGCDSCEEQTHKAIDSAFKSMSDADLTKLLQS